MTKGQEAARSFATAIESRKAAIIKVSDVEFKAFEADVVEEIGHKEIESFKESILQADALVEQAGEALEAAGKKPNT